MANGPPSTAPGSDPWGDVPEKLEESSPKIPQVDVATPELQQAIIDQQEASGDQGDSDYVQDIVQSVEKDIAAGLYSKTVGESIKEAARVEESAAEEQKQAKELATQQRIETQATLAGKSPMFVHDDIYWDEDRRGFYQGTREQTEAYVAELSRLHDVPVLAMIKEPISEDLRTTQINTKEQQKEEVLAKARDAYEKGEDTSSFEKQIKDLNTDIRALVARPTATIPEVPELDVEAYQDYQTLQEKFQVKGWAGPGGLDTYKAIKEGATREELLTYGLTSSEVSRFQQNVEYTDKLQKQFPSLVSGDQFDVQSILMEGGDPEDLRKAGFAATDVARAITAVGTYREEAAKFIQEQEKVEEYNREQQEIYEAQIRELEAKQKDYNDTLEKYKQYQGTSESGPTLDTAQMIADLGYEQVVDDLRILLVSEEEIKRASDDAVDIFNLEAFERHYQAELSRFEDARDLISPYISPDGTVTVNSIITALARPDIDIKTFTDANIDEEFVKNIASYKDFYVPPDYQDKTYYGIEGSPTSGYLDVSAIVRSGKFDKRKDIEKLYKTFGEGVVVEEQSRFKIEKKGGLIGYLRETPQSELARTTALLANYEGYGAKELQELQAIAKYIEKDGVIDIAEVRKEVPDEVLIAHNIVTANKLEKFDKSAENYQQFEDNLAASGFTPEGNVLPGRELTTVPATVWQEAEIETSDQDSISFEQLLVYTSPEWAQYYKDKEEGKDPEKPVIEEISAADLQELYNADVTLEELVAKGYVEGTPDQLEAAGLSKSKAEELGSKGPSIWSRAASFGMDLIPIVGTTRLIIRSAKDGFSKKELGFIAASGAMDVFTIITLGTGAAVATPVRAGVLKAGTKALTSIPMKGMHQPTVIAIHNAGQLAAEAGRMGIVVPTLLTKITTAPLRAGVKAALHTDEMVHSVKTLAPKFKSVLKHKDSTGAVKPLDAPFGTTRGIPHAPFGKDPVTGLIRTKAPTQSIKPFEMKIPLELVVTDAAKTVGRSLRTMEGMFSEVARKTVGTPVAPAEATKFVATSIGKDIVSTAKTTWQTPIPDIVGSTAKTVTTTVRHPIQSLKATGEVLIGKRILNPKDARLFQQAGLQAGADFADIVTDIAAQTGRSVQVQEVIKPGGELKYSAEQLIADGKVPHYYTTVHGEQKVDGWYQLVDKNTDDLIRVRVTKDARTGQTEVEITGKQRELPQDDPDFGKGPGGLGPDGVEYTPFGSGGRVTPEELGRIIAEARDVVTPISPSRGWELPVSPRLEAPVMSKEVSLLRESPVSRDAEILVTGKRIKSPEAPIRRPREWEDSPRRDVRRQQIEQPPEQPKIAEVSGFRGITPIGPVGLKDDKGQDIPVRWDRDSRKWVIDTDEPTFTDATGSRVSPLVYPEDLTTTTVMPVPPTAPARRQRPREPQRGVTTTMISPRFPSWEPIRRGVPITTRTPGLPFTRTITEPITTPRSTTEMPSITPSGVPGPRISTPTGIEPGLQPPKSILAKVPSLGTLTVTEPKLATAPALKQDLDISKLPLRRRSVRRRIRRSKVRSPFPDKELEEEDKVQTALLTIDTQPAGSGRGIPKTRRIKVGKFITITASPNKGWKFDHWEGDIEPQYVNRKRANILMEDDRVIQAVFVPGGKGDQVYIHKVYPTALKSKKHSEVARMKGLD